MAHIEDPEFQDTTVIVDGVHIRSQYFFSEDEAEQLPSFKMKGKNAINFLDMEPEDTTSMPSNDVPVILDYV